MNVASSGVAVHSEWSDRLTCLGNQIIHSQEAAEIMLCCVYDSTDVVTDVFMASQVPQTDLLLGKLTAIRGFLQRLQARNCSEHVLRAVSRTRPRAGAGLFQSDLADIVLTPLHQP